uniref:Uncharacterized protein n=1 Tax=Lepeophtheirus salmonis TaxID=72036 RepID=A0A0K2VAH6_LEPSM
MRRLLSLMMQCRWELRLVFTNFTNHGNLPPQELLSELIRGKKIITSHIVTPQSLGQIKYNTHPLGFLWVSIGQLSCIYLDFPSITGFDIASHPKFYLICCRLTWHILLERTTTFRRRKKLCKWKVLEIKD